MEELKCKNCGAPVEVRNGRYVCAFCKTEYIKETQPGITQKVVFNIRNAENIGIKTDPTRLVLSDTATTILRNAYRNNTLLEEVVFSSNTFMIQDGAFEGCVNLKVIKNCDSVKHFGDYAFKGTGLNEICIGQNVETIGKEAFSCMPNLEKVVYKPNKNMRLKDTFIKCPNLKNVEIDQPYFFPSFVNFNEVKNNPNNVRPTIKDAFWGTPFFTEAKEEYAQSIKDGICPDCGERIKKGLFHTRCENCGIDLKN